MKNYNCLWETPSNQWEVKLRSEFRDKHQVKDLYSIERKVRTKQNNFTPYNSMYAAGFGLTDTLKIPRPCALLSLNMTAVDYYRG